ncbi:metallophosphoesterase [Hallella faecis]|uniref:Metallophosphoesterase n=1 Tax=Hallella faecis TaxID=2841596 RepID=A0ABV1FN50_9BACT|nr:metallophosphoesterase [Hallella faecis]MBU0288948.1 metallophosphoesterase [Hallella faecis]
MKKAECIMFPDLHGRDFWKKALANSCEWTANRLIFLGDYFDPYPSDGIAPNDAIRNWWELQLTLRQHPNKEVVFLMGNHDAHYVSATF